MVDTFTLTGRLMNHDGTPNVREWFVIHAYPAITVGDGEVVTDLLKDQTDDEGYIGDGPTEGLQLVTAPGQYYKFRQLNGQAESIQFEAPAAGTTIDLDTVIEPEFFPPPTSTEVAQVLAVVAEVAGYVAEAEGYVGAAEAAVAGMSILVVEHEDETSDVTVGAESGFTIVNNGDGTADLTLDGETVTIGGMADLTEALANVSIEGHAHTTDDITDLEQWRIDNRIAKIETYDSDLSETPGAVGNAVLWLNLATTPTSLPAITYVTHQHDTTNAASWTFTPENLLSSFSSYDYFVAYAWTANATSLPANDADSLTGGGMTWAPVGSAASSASGVLTLSAFRSTAGTPDGTDLVLGATGGAEGATIEVAAVRDLPYVSTVLSGTGALSTASLTVTGATASQRIIAGIGWNSGSQTISADPGTPLGTTPDVTMASPSLKTRASVVSPAATSIQWTKSGNSQQVYGGILVGTP